MPPRSVGCTIVDVTPAVRAGKPRASRTPQSQPLNALRRHQAADRHPAGALGGEYALLKGVGKQLYRSSGSAARFDRAFSSTAAQRVWRAYLATLDEQTPGAGRTESGLSRAASQSARNPRLAEHDNIICAGDGPDPATRAVGEPSASL